MHKYDVEKGLFVPQSELHVGGKFFGQHLREGRVIDEWESKNLIVNQGLDHILGVEFAGVAQITTWYMAPFGNNYTPVGTDTAASIVANAGEVTSYTGSSRVPYVGTEGSQQVTNGGAPSSFTFNADATIYGAFLISSSAFGATSGVLFAASPFGSGKQVHNTDQILLTYILGAVSA